MDLPIPLNCILIWMTLFASLKAQTYTISVTEVEGKPIMYTCTTNPAQTGVKWTEDFRDAPPSNYVFVFYNGNCVLSVGSPPADYVFDCDASGTFTVTFNVTFKRNYKSKWKCGINTAPTPESAWSDLNVTVALTTLEVSKDSTVQAGGTAKLTCSTNPCAPVPDISWMKENSAFASGSVKQSQTFTDNGYIGVSELSLENVNSNAAASYSCRATYGSKTITSEASYLDINDQPKDSSDGPDPDVIAGGVVGGVVGCAACGGLVYLIKKKLKKGKNEDNRCPAATAPNTAVDNSGNSSEATKLEATNGTKVSSQGLRETEKGGT